ncbi:hypothetical protein LCGC14_3094650 [marine sediment metagenome]|uniref:Uncharacterized protein n=1 Tax=marine sediment metagenome TaxID=412755 RepID=A0A0F8W9K7_9ZZZZ
MALTKTVTPISVKKQMDKLWNVALSLQIFDDAVEVYNQNFSVRYREGEDIADKELKFQAKMQKAIDDYKAEQVIFTHAKMNTMVTNLNNNLVV